MRKLRPSVTTFMVVWCSAFLVGKLFGASTSFLLRDPLSPGGGQEYLGVISFIGMLGWCASAAFCILGARLLQARNDTPEAARFLRWTATVTTVLLFDDLLLIHEFVFPKILGLPEEVAYGLYAIGFAVYWRKFLGFMRTDTRFRIYAYAIALLALSVLCDAHVIPVGNGTEDLLKYAGTGLYVCFCLLTTSDLVQATAVPSSGEMRADSEPVPPAS